MNEPQLSGKTGPAGSSPFSGTIFSSENSCSDSGERSLNKESRQSAKLGLVQTKKICEPRRMFEPLVVSYRNLSARVVYAPSDGLYHATWSFGGLRGKTASKDPEIAKQNVLEKLNRLPVN